jgi:hypothetical protein
LNWQTSLYNRFLWPLDLAGKSASVIPKIIT